MKKVLLRAPLLTNSGYGVHSRQVFKWLHSKEDIDLTVECLNWGSTPWIIDTNRESGLIAKIMSCSKKVEGKYDITYQLQLPDEWNPELGHYNVGMTAAVETDKCNPVWLEHCNKMDMIVVPSTFTKNVLKRSGLLLKNIVVIPEWFNEAIPNSTTKLKNLNMTTSFNFLTIGMLTHDAPDLDRKNLANTIKWFCENFKNNDDVGLVIKTCMGRGSTFDRKRTVSYFNSLMKSFKKELNPKIYLIHGSMKHEEIAALYHDPVIKGYLSLTRGEGYGLPLVDAAAAGLPIIATNYSGHLEYLQKDSFLPVSYKSIPVPDKKIDNRIFVKGVKWVEPEKDSYFTRMNELYNNEELYRNKAKEYAKYVQENYSSEAIMKLYDSVFSEIV